MRSLNLALSVFALTVLVGGAGFADTETENVPLPRVFDTGLSGLSGITSGVSSVTRTRELTSRDTYEHPLMTFLFAGPQSRSKALEILPTDTYWSELLDLVVGARGHVTVLVDPKQMDAMQKASGYRLSEYLETYDVAPFDENMLAKDNSIDFIFMARKVGMLMREGNLSKVLVAANKALKPGGTLLVVDYRADNNHEQDPKAATGYIREDYAIAAIQGAGFKLADKEDELLANPKDTRTKAGPTSDRFLLKFTKLKP